MISKRILVSMVLAIAGSGGRALATDHTGWFPFYMPWNDTSVEVVNQAWSVPRPAGAKGFLQTTPEGTFRFADSPERVRFTGFVSVAQANFPDSADAPLIAARLAKLGVNLMRVHLMDVDGVYGVFATGTDTRSLDPVRMRRMDWFLKNLRDRGIYYNFCVQAGRVFKSGDSLRAPVTNDQSKFVTLFDPRLMDLQKEFAAAIANHVNPYTGLAYGKDPAVATWELTNENQLYMGWLSWGSSSWDSLSASNPGGIAPASYRYLDTLWNLWLARRYLTDSALSVAWSGVSGTLVNQIANRSFETNLSGWSNWTDPASEAAMSVGRTTAQSRSGVASLRVSVSGTGAKPGDASLIKTGLSARAGGSYRLRWWARTTVPAEQTVSFLKESEWTWYGDGRCQVDTSWTPCETFVSVPESLSGNLRFNLGFGDLAGVWWIDSVSFEEFPGEGLRPGESLDRFSVRRSSRSTLGALTAARVSDESRFYAATESVYIARLGGYLRDTLGIRVPVTFTNNWYGTGSIASQARADYVDGHWYWDHPNFPDGWSNTEYSMHDRPMVRDAAGSTVSSFSLMRVKGKPLVSSEYNHPWPNEFQSEVMAFHYAWLGFLDADGGLLHAYADYDLARYKLPYLEQFFNAGLNPVLMSQMALARLFRTGRIAPTTTWRDVSLTDSSLHADARMRRDGRPSLPPRALLQTPMRWEGFDATVDRVPLAVDPGSRIVSNTGELVWDESKGLFQIDNRWWQGAVGFLAGGSAFSRLVVRTFSATGGMDFGAVHLVSTDSSELGSGAPMLLLTSARVENPGTVWNAAHTALTRRFLAKDTVLCEPVKGWIGVLPGRRDSVSVWALAPTGARGSLLPVSWSGDTLWIELPGTSLWYEVVPGNASSPTVKAAPRSVRNAALHPGARSLEWSLPEGGTATLRLDARDASGSLLAWGSHTLTGSRGRVALPAVGTGMVFWEARLESLDGTQTKRWKSARLAR